MFLQYLNDTKKIKGGSVEKRLVMGAKEPKQDNFIYQVHSKIYVISTFCHFKSLRQTSFRPVPLINCVISKVDKGFKEIYSGTKRLESLLKIKEMGSFNSDLK